MSTSIYLDFEQPIETLENKLKELESSKNDSPDRHDEIRNVRKQLTDTIREIYGDLTPWQTVEVARHQKRPQSADYLNLSSTSSLNCMAIASSVTIAPYEQDLRNSTSTR